VLRGVLEVSVWKGTPAEALKRAEGIVREHAASARLWPPAPAYMSFKVEPGSVSCPRLKRALELAGAYPESVVETDGILTIHVADPKASTQGTVESAVSAALGSDARTVDRGPSLPGVLAHFDSDGNLQCLSLSRKPYLRTWTKAVPVESLPSQEVPCGLFELSLFPEKALAWAYISGLETRAEEELYADSPRKAFYMGRKWWAVLSYNWDGRKSPGEGHGSAVEYSRDGRAVRTVGYYGDARGGK